MAAGLLRTRQPSVTLRKPETAIDRSLSTLVEAALKLALTSASVSGLEADLADVRGSRDISEPADAQWAAAEKFASHPTHVALSSS